MSSINGIEAGLGILLLPSKTISGDFVHIWLSLGCIREMALHINSVFCDLPQKVVTRITDINQAISGRYLISFTF